ncbi:unnamed protein product [Peniophora sp. CBMAI 1063]|nr:unnamed protein product [Peniophora sp. CBMAI 1063]
MLPHLPSAPLLLVLLCRTAVTFAQDFTIPVAWQNTASNASYNKRVDIAFGAASELQHKVVPSLGYPGDVSGEDAEYSNRTIANMVIVLASQDWRRGNTSWKEQVETNTLSFYEAGRKDLDSRIQNIDTCTFGLAEIASYLAYGNGSSHLDIAKRNFDIVYSDFITPTAAQHGAYPRKLKSTCGATLGGLLFFNHGSDDLTVHGSAIGSWITLSARLYELTRNATYLTTAEQSIQFMNTYLAKPEDSISGSFDPTSCEIDPGIINADDIGFYIEGLSIVANVTANQTYTQMLDALMPFIVSFRDWHTSDGILSTDSPWCSKGIYMRGLLEARLRNPSNTGLIALIDAYLTIQFNAVQTNAAIGGNDYALSWQSGSHSSSQSVFSTLGSVEALDALNAAFVIAPTNASQPRNTTQPTNINGLPTPTTNPAPSGTQRHASTSIAVIVGASVGGGVGVFVALIAICVCLRRQKRTRETPDLRVDTKQGDSLQARRTRLVPEPFTQDAPLYDPTNPVHIKAGGWHRAGFLVRPTPDISRDSLPSNPSVDVVGGASGVETRQSVGDPDALNALERRLGRRLDDLIQTLAVRGETESNPPGYDGTNTEHTARG